MGKRSLNPYWLILKQYLIGKRGVPAAIDNTDLTDPISCEQLVYSTGMKTKTNVVLNRRVRLKWHDNQSCIIVSRESRVRMCLIVVYIV